jgi:hypothetical protein
MEVGLFLALVGLLFITIAVVSFVQDAFPGAARLSLVFTTILPSLFSLMGLFLLWVGLWLRRPEPPALQVTAAGIVDRVAPILGMGLIPWEEIVEVRAHRYPLGGGSLAIWLRDPARVIGRKRALVRFIITYEAQRVLLTGSGRNPPTLNLDGRLVDGDLDELVDEIRAAFPLVLQAYGIVVGRDPRRERRHARRLGGPG